MQPVHAAAVDLLSQCGNPQDFEFGCFEQGNDHAAFSVRNGVDVRSEVPSLGSSHGVGIMFSQRECDADLASLRAGVDRCDLQRMGLACSNHGNRDPALRMIVAG
jgi:hypothetical protein